MIFSPKPGRLVRVHYREVLRSVCLCHGRVGVVVRAARGPGPRNVEVLFPAGGSVVCPRGNLVAVREGNAT